MDIYNHEIDRRVTRNGHREENSARREMSCQELTSEAKRRELTSRAERHELTNRAKNEETSVRLTRSI